VGRVIGKAGWCGCGVVIIDAGLHPMSVLRWIGWLIVLQLSDCRLSNPFELIGGGCVGMVRVRAGCVGGRGSVAVSLLSLSSAVLMGKAVPDLAGHA